MGEDLEQGITLHGCKGDVKGCGVEGLKFMQGSKEGCHMCFPLQEEATPEALKRKAVSPGDKSRPFGIDKELEAVWGESERG